MNLIKGFIKKNVPPKILRWYKNKSTAFSVISYPKCGRTWLRMLLGKYLDGIYKLNLKLDEMSEVQKFINYNETIPLVNFSHYGSPHLVHMDNIDVNFTDLYNRKVIFLVRDPRPVSVSYYFQFMYRGEIMDRGDKERSELNDFDGSIDEFVLGEHGGIKSVIKYYNIWAKKIKDSDEILLIRYEDLLENIFGELLDVFNYLGLEIDTAQMKKSIKFCRAENLKKLEIEDKLNKQRFGGSSEKNRKVRKPERQDWFNEVSTETKLKMNNYTKNRLSKIYGYS